MADAPRIEEGGKPLFKGDENRNVHWKSVETEADVISGRRNAMRKVGTDIEARMPPQVMPPLLERETPPVNSNPERDGASISDQTSSLATTAVWGGHLGLGGGGNPLTSPDNTIKMPPRDRLDTIHSIPSQVFHGTSRQSVCCNRCYGEDGGCSAFFVRQVALFTVAVILASIGFGFRQNEKTEAVTTGKTRINIWFLYVAFALAYYVLTEWLEMFLFWLIFKILTPCGRITRTFNFYLSSFESTAGKIIWSGTLWAIYRPIFGISIKSNWLDHLWATLLTVAIVNGFRILIQRWILSNLLRTTYEHKVDELLKRIHVLKLLATPFTLRDISHRSTYEEWASEPNVNMATEESRLLDTKASLAEKLNHVRVVEFTLPGPNHQTNVIKRGQDLSPVIEAVFTRLVRIPYTIVREAGRTAKLAAFHVSEGSATAGTFVSASDAVYKEGDVAPVDQEGVIDDDEVGIYQSTGHAVTSESSDGLIDEDEAKKASRDLSPSDDHDHHMLKKTSDGGLSDDSSQKKSKSRATLSKMLMKRAKKKTNIKGELTRAHFFLLLGKTFTSPAVARFDSNGDGAVMFDEFSAEFFDTLRLHKSLRESESSHQSVSKAIYYLGTGLAMLVCLIIVLSIWDIPLAEVFVPIGTLLIAASFAIGGTLQDLLASLIFLTVVQPYDVGDRVTSPSLLDGETLFVDKIDVITTTFRRLNGKKFIHYNARLTDYILENHKRSKSATFIVKLNMSYDTTDAQIAQLKSMMLDYLTSHSRQWRPELALLTDSASPGPANMLSVSIWITHHLGWQDGLDIWSSHSAFVMHAVEAMKRIGISYRLPPRPIHILKDNGDPIQSTSYSSL